MIDTKALRQKILDMAIKGKLVPQDPNDEPASVLLERIRAEKQQLIKDGKIKKDKNDSVIYKGDDNRHYEKVDSEIKDITDDLPFEIPDNWAWIRLGYVVDFSQNDTVAANQINPLSWVLDLEDIEKDSGKLFQKKTMDQTQSKSDKHRFYKGNVLYSKLRPYLNKVIVADDDGYCTTEILTFDFGQCIDAQYAQIFLMSPHFVDYAMAGSYGVKMPRIGSHRGNSALIPLPPYSEQKKIITQTKELFEQIEIIEQNQAHIDTLYEEFRKRTLTLAIQGKLVPQNPNDEPASVLLERIRAEKKAKLGKKYVDSYIYKGDDNCYYEHIAGRAQDKLVEVPFDIPKGWSWSRIVTISDSYIGLTYKPTDIVNDDGYIVLRSSNIKDGKIDLEDIVRVSSSIPDKLKVRKNDIVICARNGSKKLVGKSAIVDFDAPNLTFGAFMAICRTPLFAYVSRFLLTACFFEQLAAVSSTTTINQLTQASFNSFLVPIPPLAEQKRIVAKINEIFAML